MRATAYAGLRSMYHCTALGKALLAHWDPSMRHTLYRLRGLPRLTPHTITDIDTLEAQLPQVLARGYALDVEENEVGVNCIGTSIFNGFGDVVAAISVTGPSNRLTVDAMDRLATDVIAAANAITAALGCGERPDNRESRKHQ